MKTWAKLLAVSFVLAAAIVGCGKKSSNNNAAYCDAFGCYDPRSGFINDPVPNMNLGPNAVLLKGVTNLAPESDAKKVYRRYLKGINACSYRLNETCDFIDNFPPIVTVIIDHYLLPNNVSNGRLAVSNNLLSTAQYPQSPLQQIQYRRIDGKASGTPELVETTQVSPWYTWGHNLPLTVRIAGATTAETVNVELYYEGRRFAVGSLNRINKK